MNDVSISVINVRVDSAHVKRDKVSSSSTPLKNKVAFSHKKSGSNLGVSSLDTFRVTGVNGPTDM